MGKFTVANLVPGETRFIPGEHHEFPLEKSQLDLIERCVDVAAANRGMKKEQLVDLRFALQAFFIQANIYRVMVRSLFLGSFLADMELTEDGTHRLVMDAVHPYFVEEVVSILNSMPQEPENYLPVATGDVKIVNLPHITGKKGTIH